jgi:host factor-I protein
MLANRHLAAILQSVVRNVRRNVSQDGPMAGIGADPVGRRPAAHGDRLWRNGGGRQDDHWSRSQTTRRINPMSTEKTQNVQDVFLNHIRKNKVPVTIFLINGVKLQGVVSSFDNFSLLLRRDGHVQLVYKHAVSTVMPATVVRLYEPSSEEAATAG